MDKSVFDRHHVQSDTEAKTQKEAFHIIAHVVYEVGYVKDENAYSEGMCERKKEATTGFQDGVAIPHSKHTTCIKPGISLAKLEHPIAWNALDSEPVRVTLGLTIPEDGDDVYLRILSELVHKTIGEGSRTTLKTGTDIDTLYGVVAAVKL